MKPNSDTMEREIVEPSELYLNLGMLIIEGRLPELSQKGRYEGPHCPGVQSVVSSPHTCDTNNILCKQAMYFRREMMRLWRNDIPLCVDVLLLPVCGHGNHTGQGHKATNDLLLLERWNIQSLTRRVESTADIRGLFQAVRSFLYFSQLSAWYNKSQGKAPVSVICRLHAPGESEMVPFLEQPTYQSFPVPTISRGLGLKVCVSSLPRRQEIPTVSCCHSDDIIKQNKPDSSCQSNNYASAKSKEHVASHEKNRKEDEGKKELTHSMEHENINLSHCNLQQTQGAIPKRHKWYYSPQKEPKSTSPEEKSEYSSQRDETVPQVHKTEATSRMTHQGARTSVTSGRTQPESQADKSLGLSPKSLVDDISTRDSDTTHARQGEISKDTDRTEYASDLHRQQCLYRSAPDTTSPISLEIDTKTQHSNGASTVSGAQSADIPVARQQPPQSLGISPPRGQGHPDRPLVSPMVLVSQKSPGQSYYHKGVLGMPKRLFKSDDVFVEAQVYHKYPQHNIAPSNRVRLALFKDDDSKTTSIVEENYLKDIYSTEIDKPVASNDGKEVTDDILTQRMKSDLSLRDGSDSQQNGRVTGDNKECHLLKQTICNKPKEAPVFYFQGDVDEGQFTGHPITGLIRQTEDITNGHSPTKKDSKSLFKTLLKQELEQKAGKDVEHSDRSGRPIPSSDERSRFRRSLEGSSSVLFSRTGLPTQSSPAPLKRRTGSGSSFDFDNSLTNVRAIKNAISCSVLDSDSDHTESPDDRSRYLSTSAPASTNRLLGNFEESLLNGRIEPVGTVQGFTVEIGASGSFCPKHVSLPVTAYFFSLSEDNAPSPYLGHISLESLGKRGYHVPKKGTIQVTLFNPNKTVVKMFVVMYNLSDMPANCQTFLRQRTLYMPVPSDACPDTQHLQSYLRYLIHARFSSSKSGRIYLHTDLRLIFSRDKFEFDPSVATYELRSVTEGPTNPKFSPKRRI